MYHVKITQPTVEYGTNRPIYQVDTVETESGHVCDTLSWFSIDKARKYAAEMSDRSLDCPIVDETVCVYCDGEGEASYDTDDAGYPVGGRFQCYACNGTGTRRPITERIPAQPVNGSTDNDWWF
jgi:hypothetical protein